MVNVQTSQYRNIVFDLLKLYGSLYTRRGHIVWDPNRLSRYPVKRGEEGREEDGEDQGDINCAVERDMKKSMGGDKIVLLLLLNFSEYNKKKRHKIILKGMHRKVDNN